MKARLIYKEVSSYYWGKNPADDKRKYHIEFNGKNYYVYLTDNYTNSVRSIKEEEKIDEANLPEEYYRDDGSTIYSLRHGEVDEEIYINLDDFNFYELPKDIQRERNRELETREKEIRQKVYEEYKDYDIKSITGYSELTDKEKQLLEKYRISVLDSIVSYRFSGKPRYISTPFEELMAASIDVIKGRAMLYTVNNNSQFIVQNPTNAGVSSHILYPKKEVLLPNGKTYIGSTIAYAKDGTYPMDIYKKTRNDGKVVYYTHQETYSPWYDINNDYIGRTKYIGIDRFDATTGESDEKLSEIDNKVKTDMHERRKFFKETMEMVKKEFGLSDKQCKHLLEFSKNISAFRLAALFKQHHFTVEDAQSIMRKISHSGAEKVFESKGMDYVDLKFDVIQEGALVFSYIENLIEQDSPDRLDRTTIYTCEDIGSQITPWKSQLDEVYKEMTEEEISKDEIDEQETNAPSTDDE